LKTKADEIVQAMHQGKGVVPGEVVVELGAGYVMKLTNDIISDIQRPEHFEKLPSSSLALRGS
jgi:hypothetical protein